MDIKKGQSSHSLLQTFSRHLVPLAFALAIEPLLIFCLAWIGGLLLNWYAGLPIMWALNTLFGTTRFDFESAPYFIPAACGMIATGRHYWKSTWDFPTLSLYL